MATKTVTITYDDADPPKSPQVGKGYENAERAGSRKLRNYRANGRAVQKVRRK